MSLDKIKALLLNVKVMFFTLLIVYAVLGTLNSFFMLVDPGRFTMSWITLMITYLLVLELFGNRE